ncbi:MAG: deaminase domain-containing protein [Planctomycetaceae bacterium]
MVSLHAGGELITATGRHPVWVVRGEALSQRPITEELGDDNLPSRTKGRWVEARYLEVGDLLLTPHGELRVDDLFREETTAQVFNLQIANVHAYTVGNASILVHNDSLLPKLAVSAGSISNSECRSNIEDLRQNLGLDQSVVSYVEFSIDKEYDELVAVSGENTPAGTVGFPASPLFSPSVVGTYLRDVDAEYKLLEEVAARLKQAGCFQKAVVRLCIESEPCDSCADVIRQFRVEFPEPQVTLYVTYL